MNGYHHLCSICKISICMILLQNLQKLWKTKKDVKIVINPDFRPNLINTNYNSGILQTLVGNNEGKLYYDSLKHDECLSYSELLPCFIETVTAYGGKDTYVRIPSNMVSIWERIDLIIESTKPIRNIIKKLKF